MFPAMTEVMRCSLREYEMGGIARFELLTLVLFIWLLWKAVGLAFRLSWGVAKITASILLALAMPLLVVCLVFAGGIVLLAPLGVIAAAVCILKFCT